MVRDEPKKNAAKDYIKQGPNNSKTRIVMIKNKLIILLVLLMLGLLQAQISVIIQNNFGYTLVDVSEAMEIPEYSEITDEGLVDWNQFNYKGLIQIFKQNDQSYSLGGELGIHRLYYWEKKFYPSINSSARWNRGTIWTAQAGVLIKKTIAEQYYLMTGASLHFFLNGSGTTVGFPIAMGHEIRLSKIITIPVEFRMDMIFGKSTPIGLGGGVGIQYKFNGQHNDTS